MNAFSKQALTVATKELTDGSRDKRALLAALLGPIWGPLVVVVLFSVLAHRQKSESLEVVVDGMAYAPVLMQFFEAQGIHPLPAQHAREALIADIRKGEIPLALVVAPDFSPSLSEGRPAAVELITDDSRDEKRILIAKVNRALEGFSMQHGMLRLSARGIDPTIARPLKVSRLNVATSRELSARIFNIVPIFVLMAAFLGGMYIAIDASAGERERGSLEPLLLTPASRQAMALGKASATFLFSAVAVVVTIAVLTLSLRIAPLEDLGLSLRLSVPDALMLVGLSLPLCAFAAGVQLAVATLSRSFREAQTTLTLVMLIPTLPGIMLSLFPEPTHTWMRFVPVVNQQLLFTDVIRGAELSAGWVLLATVTSLFGSALAIGLAGHLLAKESVIYGKS